MNHTCSLSSSASSLARVDIFVDIVVDDDDDDRHRSTLDDMG